jgi:hypothetical protein
MLQNIISLTTSSPDIDALWKKENEEESSTPSSTVHDLFASTSSRRNGRPSLRQHRSSMRLAPRRFSSNFDTMAEDNGTVHKLELPTGPSDYNERCWLSHDIKKIRGSYVNNGIIFPMFESGLIAFYGGQWDHAKQCFELVLTQINDGPSNYFLKIIKKHNGVPPPDFIGYGLEE